MNLLDQRIRTFASQGLSPYEIEERLGMEHYTIHIKYHQALMNGYTTAPASGQAHALSAEEKAERKRERAKERREEKKAEAKKQGEVPKRVEMTHEERLARRREYDARYRRKHREEYNRKRRELYHAAKKQGEVPKRVEMTHEERLARRREYDARYRRKHREEYNRKRRELYHAMSLEKKKALFERLVEYKKATYEQRKDMINERRRELRRLRKEQANAKKQKAAQGVQTSGDTPNGVLPSPGRH